MTAGRKQQMPAYDYLAPAAGYTPWATPAVQYDTRGRLQPFVETSEQRRARAEFLRKREFSRRIHAWIQGSEVRPLPHPINTLLTPCIEFRVCARIEQIS